MKIALCAIAKNELNYIEEWVAYHKIVGFDDIFIYDNVSDDGTSELLQALNKIGEIKRIHWPRKENVPPQRHAYNDFLEYYARNYDYVLICDIDEFFYTHFNSVKDFILNAKKANNNFGAIAIPWLMFGANGKEFKEPGLVMDRFNTTRSYMNSEVKSLFDPNKAFNMRTHICDLISGDYLDNNFNVAVWADKRPIDLAAPEIGKACICHFYTKSKEEWIVRRTGMKADRAQAEYRNLNEFSKFNDAKTSNNFFQFYISRVHEKISLVRNLIANSSSEVVDFKVTRYDGAWIFCKVRLEKPLGSLDVNVLLNDHTEFNVKTIPQGCDQLIIIRVKWKVDKLKSLKLSIPSARFSYAITKKISINSLVTLNFLIKHMPSSEENIFEFFLKSIADPNNFVNVKKINYPNFNKFTDQGRYLSLILNNYKDNCFNCEKFIKEIEDEKFSDRSLTDFKNKLNKYKVNYVSFCFD